MALLRTFVIGAAVGGACLYGFYQPHPTDIPKRGAGVCYHLFINYSSAWRDQHFGGVAGNWFEINSISHIGHKHRHHYLSQPNHCMYIHPFILKYHSS
jgi:hypothetical protein